MWIQNKILTQCELSLAEAAKKMKKSKEVAKEAIRQKMQANKVISMKFLLNT